MRMLMLVYSGPSPQRMSQLIDRHQVSGYMEFRNVHGVGTTGRREGSRAWPGESTIFVSVVPDAQVEEVVDGLRAETDRLHPGERLHVAVLPVETFF